MTDAPKYRKGEPVCLYYCYSLPTCRKEDRFIAHRSNPLRWLDRKLFVEIPSHELIFGYVVGWDDSETIVHAGAEWTESDILFALYVMIFPSGEPVLVRIPEDEPELYQIIDKDKFLLRNHCGFTIDGNQLPTTAKKAE